MANDKKDLFRAAWIMFALTAPTPATEYRFHPERRWRFDFAWPDVRVAVEVNGNAWAVRGGGRHGKDADLEKGNAAAAAGWRVFTFSPAMLERDPAACVDVVRAAVEGDHEHS